MRGRFSPGHRGGSTLYRVLPLALVSLVMIAAIGFSVAISPTPLTSADCAARLPGGVWKSAEEEAISKIPGLTHLYPLNSRHGVCDTTGTVHGTIRGNVSFTLDEAVFDGASSIELPDRNEFSSTGTRGLSVAMVLIVDDWAAGSRNNEYVNFLGKGNSSAGHEWAFRYYVDGGTAPDRHRRESFYAFNRSGGLGAGSFCQSASDPHEGKQVLVGSVGGNASNGGRTRIWHNGLLCDTDALSSFGINPANTRAPVFLGTRGDNTGHLVGRLSYVAFFDHQLTEAEVRAFQAAVG